MAIDWQAIQRENDELTERLADPAVAADADALAKIGKRKKELDELLELRDGITHAEQAVADAKQLAAGEDESLKQLAVEEQGAVQERLERLRGRLAELTRERDPDDAKPAIVEIRAGAGGDEASLFAKELYGMYVRFAEANGLRPELLSSNPSEVGGFKEVIFNVDGDEAYGLLRYEGGTHRVQRIPATESGGRIHTSTATVAVLPEAEESELDIKPEEIRVDVFRSSGPGGQSVNTTDSAVRITHVPTGMTVSCQDEKSQHKNRAKAMQILRSRLKAQQDAEAVTERGDVRRSQIGTGDRSEKIRTYNFPQDRITDHRIKRSFPKVKGVLAGELRPLVDAVRSAAHEEA
ncbi:MAG: peptide chain release factor 1 [Patescibacteria group bacterium]